jgi:transposase-like protein
MAEMSCKRCGAAHYTKKGIVREWQRYGCKECAYNFTARSRAANLRR